MDKTLIIYAHPNQTSLNHAILTQVVNILKKQSVAYDIIDLYADNFNPVLSKQALIDYDKPSQDLQIIDYVEKLKTSNRLILIYPIWWYRGPAIFEGFLDRVFTKETAFSYALGYHEGCFDHIKEALVLTTSAQTTIDLVNICNDPITSMLINGTLYYAGIKNAKWLNLQLSEQCDADAFEKHIQLIKSHI